jgi:UDP-glucose 4-epimerase
VKNVEICGKGYLGTFASRFFSDKSDVTTRFSEKSFQYYGVRSESTQFSTDLLLNLSGPTSVEASMRDREYYADTPLKQVSAHIDLLSQMLNPPHYVFMSTAAVYGECSDVRPDELYPVSPISPYAYGKLRAEDFLRSLINSYTGGITIIRATSVFSENLQSRVLGRIRQELRNKQEVELFGDGSEKRDFIHAEDFFEVLTILISASIQQGGVNVYNLGSGESISMLELADIALQSQIGGVEKKVRFNGIKRNGDPHEISVCVKKQNDACPEVNISSYKRLSDYFNY